MKVVLASGNRGKLAELQKLLAPLSLELVSQSDLNISSAPEPFETFIENSLTKARHASAASGIPALADDSGLVVPQLNGAPGVHSARFAGEGATDADNSAHLTARLRAEFPEQTLFPAHYFCALVFLTQAADPAPLVACAQWHGQIRLFGEGDNGFGYDPYFYLSDLKQTAAQLDSATKNRLSHRGLAVQLLLTQLRAQLENQARSSSAN